MNFRSPGSPSMCGSPIREKMKNENKIVVVENKD